MSFDSSPADMLPGGGFRAIIATLAPAIDWQGDVSLPAAFDSQSQCYVSDWEHQSFDDKGPKRPPVGVCAISHDERYAYATGYFLNTPRGQECRELVKSSTALEWSYGFSILASATDAKSLQQYGAGARRILQRLMVVEVSPVVRGAGLDTRTLWVKGAREIRVDAEIAAIAANVRKYRQIISDSPEQRWLREVERNLRRNNGK